jgi:hypothetical protein
MKSLLIILVLMGCGDDSATPNDAPVDTLPDHPIADAAPDGAVDASCISLALLAQADTVITSSTPNLNFGSGPVANVGTGINSVGLFRFDVTALPTSARIQSAHLELTFAARSSACANNCGSCMSIEHSGNLALFYLRSDWTESMATWNQATAGLAWGAAGASQSAIDRSATPVAMITHQPAASESLSIDASALADLNGVWRRSNQVSFELVPSNFGVFVIATRESAAEACVAGGYGPARLVVEYCP